MGHWCMMVEGQMYCMKFEDYKATGWNQEQSVLGHEIFPNSDAMRSTEQVIADRISRDRNLNNNNIGETL